MELKNVGEHINCLSYTNAIMNTENVLINILSKPVIKQTCKLIHTNKLLKGYYQTQRYIYSER